MNIVEIAKELNDTYKTEREKNLETKIRELEKIIENLAQRIEYLEHNVRWLEYLEHNVH